MVNTRPAPDDALTSKQGAVSHTQGDNIKETHVSLLPAYAVNSSR